MSLRNIQVVSPVTYEYGPDKLRFQQFLLLFVGMFPKYSSYFQTTSALKRLSAIFRDDGIFGFHIVCSLRPLPARISYNSKGILYAKSKAEKMERTGKRRTERRKRETKKRGKAKRERRKRAEKRRAERKERERAKRERWEKREKEGQKERKEKEKRKKRESKAGKAERAGKRRTERKERERERKTKNKRGRAKRERQKEREKEEKETTKAVSSPQPCTRHRVFPLQKSRNPRFRL